MSEQTIDAVQADAAALPPPAYELGVQAPISSTPQQVSDDHGNTTQLYLGSNIATVGPVQGTPDPRLEFVVSGEVRDYALLAVQSTGAEASIQYLNAGGIRWHVGSGGGPGPEGFFIWNEKAGVILAISGTTLTFNGTIVANGLTLNGGATLPGIPAMSTAPAGANLESVFVDTKTGKLYYQ